MNCVHVRAFAYGAIRCLIFFGCHGSAQAMLQPASPGDTDCRPFDPGVPVHTIRTLLGVRPIGERVIADKG